MTQRLDLIVQLRQCRNHLRTLLAFSMGLNLLLAVVLVKVVS